jgi:hypothetical protein
MKIRASQLGKIMTSPRSKGEVLSQTAKSYIQELALEDKYGIRKDINSRYMDKGNLVEDEAIQLASSVLELEFVVKNEEYFSNDYIKGTPDVLGSNFILDVKSSWDATTLPWFAEECPNKDYYWQLMAYMWLCDRDKALLCYCLIDTPNAMIQDEIRRLIWKMDVDPRYKNMDSDEKELAATEHILSLHNVDRIPTDKRVKAYLIERDEQVIEQIKEKIEHAREYYNEIIEKI